ncbi:MAG: hypothetical protein MZW92_56775 [Comamonadaceae bacterium]|nr:hypothetical protein [Comamonadaceae bacterium]
MHPPAAVQGGALPASGRVAGGRKSGADGRRGAAPARPRVRRSRAAGRARPRPRAAPGRTSPGRTRPACPCARAWPGAARTHRPSPPPRARLLAAADAADDDGPVAS